MVQDAVFVYVAFLCAAAGGYMALFGLFSSRGSVLEGRASGGDTRIAVVSSGGVADRGSSYGARGPFTPDAARKFLRNPLGAVLPAAGASAAAGLVCLAITGIPTLGLLGAAAGSSLPTLVRKATKGRRAERMRAAWPEACRHLVANLQVGDSLPRALTALGTSGPLDLRPYFARFARRYSATGDFENSLEALSAELAAAGVERHLGVLRLAHRSGGPELISVLQTAAELASEKLATERDIKARQSWTVTAARVSAAAPWVILLLLSLRPATAAVYATPLGTKVVLGGAISTALGYGLMLKIGKVPSR